MGRMNINMKKFSVVSDKSAPWMGLRRWLQATSFKLKAVFAELWPATSGQSHALSYRLQAVSTTHKLTAKSLQLTASQVSTTKINISHV
jgi:hypothetical protein